MNSHGGNGVYTNGDGMRKTVENQRPHGFNGNEII
jgi:hypothetical protein